MAEEAKPTTDAELATLREMCAKPETWAVGSATALGLVARIDTERTVRLAAEARVKVLEDAGEEAILPRQMSKARAVPKEPAND